MTVNPMVVVFPQSETVIDIIVNCHRAIRYHLFLFYIQKYQGPRWIKTALKSLVVHSIYDIQNKAVNC